MISLSCSVMSWTVNGILPAVACSRASVSPSRLYRISRVNPPTGENCGNPKLNWSICVLIPCNGFNGVSISVELNPLEVAMCCGGTLTVKGVKAAIKLAHSSERFD